MMLRRIKTTLADARAGLMFRRAVGLTRRYVRADRRERALFFAAFDSLHGASEHAYGPMVQWNAAQKAQALSSLSSGAGRMTGAAGRGAALLALFYEAQTAPGARGEPTAAAIADWYVVATVENLASVEPAPRAELAKNRLSD